MNVFKYVVYKLYSWNKRWKNETHVLNVLLMLYLMHVCQLATILVFVSYFCQLPTEYLKNQTLVIGFQFFFFGIIYLVYKHNRNWDNYLIEFKEKTRKRKLIGTIAVLIYIVFSLFSFILAIFMLNGAF